jgi:leader peptidase (prepilin peptidase)/N-methyltransferase
MGFVLLLIPALVFRGGMGFGDVKMAALIGLVTGFPGVFVALFVGIVLGGLVAIFLLLTRMKQRKDPIPFGPFLALATMATLLYGGQLLDHYLSLLRYPIP